MYLISRYGALKALKESKSGAYFGPLRLLAHEVYNKFNEIEKIPCQLLTGEELRSPKIENLELFQDYELNHIAATVEMATEYCFSSSQREKEIPGLDVAVVDEIQMITGKREKK
jgi:ATP-dependent RNA helicase SUPV3L1/SUV3